jgi:ERF superfamily
MQRSSPSIAALATALAKAQTELANPEKSLTGTIEPQGGEGGARQFRYAPLSSGLEIVRKTLGQHEIATVQTAAVDQASGIVSLTTILAHSSGEWIASDWPVCAISETATPHRMGAALTYARRYALFTLVGIAGEDDVDAPNLSTASTQMAEAKTALGRNGKAGSKFAEPILEPQASAKLCRELLDQFNDVASADDAAIWAHRCLPEKNRLTPADAQQIEEAFQAKLATFAVNDADASQTTETKQTPKLNELVEPERAQSNVIDKSLLALAEPRRVRDRDHVRYVAQQPCLICGRRPADAHHLRFTQSRAIGRKVSDEFTVPLCRGHHREVHRHGDEAAWWQRAGIDASELARKFWLITRGNSPAITHGSAEFSAI